MDFFPCDFSGRCYFFQFLCVRSYTSVLKEVGPIVYYPQGYVRAFRNSPGNTPSVRHPPVAPGWGGENQATGC